MTPCPDVWTDELLAPARSRRTRINLQDMHGAGLAAADLLSLSSTVHYRYLLLLLVGIGRRSSGSPFSLSLFSPACVSPTPSVPLGASRLDTCHQPPYHGRQSQRLPKKDQYARASKRHSRFRCSLFPIPGRFCLLCASMLVCSSSPKPDIMPPSPSCWNLHVLHSLDPRNLSLPYRHRPCTASLSPRT